MLQVEDDYVDYSAPSFSTNRLAYLIEIEKVSSNLLSLGKELKAKEEKRVKYKDLLSALKEGKVQKDLKFWYYFEDSLFVKLSRKDSVNNTEKEVEKLTKEIANIKLGYIENKKNIIRLINSNKHIGSDISDLDLEIRVIVEKDFSR